MFKALYNTWEKREKEYTHQESRDRRRGASLIGNNCFSARPLIIVCGEKAWKERKKIVFKF